MKKTLKLPRAARLPKPGSIVIPPGSAPDAPVLIESVARGEPTPLVITVGRGARVVIVDDLTEAETTDRPCAHEVEVTALENATVEFLSLTRLPSSSICTVRQRCRLARGAKLHWTNALIGGERVDCALRSEVGEGATSSLDWLLYARGRERYSASARNVFVGTHGGGEMTMKGVAQEHGQVSVHGMIEIGPHGGGTQTYLTQNVLMLDSSSKVDAIPALEIKTNDVKASHSATVSRVTEEDLFYMTARGIDPRQAKRMFVEGFLSDLTARISSEDHRQSVVGEIARKYEQTTDVKADRHTEIVQSPNSLA